MRFDDRVTGRLAAFAPHAKVIHVDIDPAEIGKNRAPDVPIVGDVKRVLGKLNKLLAETRQKPADEARPPRAEPGGGRSAHGKQEHPFDAPTSDTEIKPQHLMARNRPALRRRRPSSLATWASTRCGRRSSSASTSRACGSTPAAWAPWASACPSAIGAQMARPDKLVFAMVGDGGFQMSIPELATIASHGLPIKIVVMNNGYLGMVRQWQTLFYNNRLSAVELDCFPDAEKLAGAYGFKGRTIDKPWELAPALEEAVREPGPYLLNVKVTPFESRLPHGARRRRHQRNGARAAAAGGGAGQVSARENSCCKSFRLLLENKPGALMRVTGLLSAARLQHRKPDGGAHARSRALAHDHRGGGGCHASASR